MRRRRFKTQADIDSYVKQGFGQGEGSSYVPWIRVQDVASRGRSRKTNGIKAERIHHTLSDLEYGYLLLLEFSDDVVDIREQYPIFPTDKARGIAVSLGIRYPMYVSTQVPFVMSSDFLITLQDKGGAKRLAVRTCKYEHELSNSADLQRTVEKLELEKAIWLDQGVEDWKLVTERAIAPTLIDNLDWLHKCARIKNTLARRDLQSQFLDGMDYTSNSERTLTSTIRSVARSIHIPYTDGVVLFKHLVWHKAIVVDMGMTRLDLNATCPSLKLVGLNSKSRDQIKVA